MAIRKDHHLCTETDNNSPKEKKKIERLGRHLSTAAIYIVIIKTAFILKEREKNSEDNWVIGSTRVSIKQKGHHLILLPQIIFLKCPTKTSRVMSHVKGFPPYQKSADWHGGGARSSKSFFFTTWARTDREARWDPWRTRH